MTATASDGSTTTTLEFPAPPEDVDKVYTGYTLVDGILTQSYVGSNGNPLPDEVQDLTALVSDDFDPVAAATALCGSPAATAILKACVDTTVTYTFPSVTDADGNVAVTPTGSDGSTGTPIVIPAPVVDTDTDTYIGPYVIDPETGIGVAPILNADGTDLMS